MDNTEKRDRKMEAKLKWNERFELKDSKLNRGKEKYASKKVEDCSGCSGSGRNNEGGLCKDCEGTGFEMGS